jgi:syntaxin 16
MSSNPYMPSVAGPSSSSTTSHPANQPITRSRTLFYLSIRDSSVTPRRGPRRSAATYGLTNDIAEEEDEGLLGGPSTRVDVKGLPPKWCVPGS